MSLRPTTVRRLAILLLGALLLVAIGCSLYIHNEQRKAARLAVARSAGIAAFKAGDYRTALDQLKTYTWRIPGDNEALYAYAVARSRVETPNGSHLTEGINALSTLLQQDPTNLDAEHRLLELYMQVYRNNDVVELADTILTDHADDRDALRAKCVALDRLHKYDAALVVSQKINDLDPTDLEQQLTSYKLMRSLGRHDAELIGRAQSQRQAHPSDPRFDLLLAWVYGNCGDVSNCMQWLTTATTRPAPDATYVRYMVRVLDQLKMYRESQELLDRAVAQSPDPLIMRVLIQRLWQSGKYTLVIDRLNQLDAASPASDTGLLAYLALSEFETNEVAASNKIINTLASRKNDADAIAWSIALMARFNHLDPKPAIAQYESALVRSPDNPVIRYFVGDAYSHMGETELAIAAWKRAADLAPSWMLPHLGIARTLAASGRAKDAVTEAEAAYRAAPDQTIAVTTLATIRYKTLEEGTADPIAQAKLLAFVSSIQKSIPGEPETLPVYVSLLARSGKKDKAIDVLHAAIADIKKYDQATILRLVAASRQYALGLDQELQNSSSPGDQQTNPRAALARAADLALSGKQADGLTILERGAKKATTQPVQWQLAIVQFKELTHDPAAAKLWIDLGETNPTDLEVQEAVLKNANSARADREFISRTIDRVRNLTGPEGQTWRLERARWLIGSGSAKDAAEAVNTLSEIVRLSPTLTDARLLLAAAYESVSNLPAATKELQQAADQDPLNDSVVVELARLLQSQGKFADARIYLDRAATAADLPDEARMRLAGMLAAQGELTRAGAVLEASKEPSKANRLQLAELYRHQGRPADAEALYARLLAEKPPTFDTIRAAADFYGAQHKPDTAEKILARLPETKPRAGMSELADATYNERWGSIDVARRKYISATLVAPNDAIVWRHLIAFNLRSGKYDQASRSADDALRSITDDASLKRLQTFAAALEQLATSNDKLRPVLTILAGAPEDRGIVDLLTQQDPASQPSSETFLARLRDAATRYPRSLALQTALVQCYVTSGRLDEAAWFAGHTMDSFPNDADSARIAAAVNRLAGRIDVAIAAAQQWRQRSAENPKPADLMLAELELARDNASAALQVLLPYATQLKSNARDNLPAVALLARAQVLGGHANDAHDLLQPMLAKGPAWRAIWLSIAGKDLPDAAAAQHWIHEVEPLLADDDDRLALGEAWYRLAVRSNDPTSLDNAAKTIDALVAKPQAGQGAMLLRAMIADRAGDPKTAEVNYRRVLKVDPANADALNNLAYNLLINGGDAQEAKTLSAKAVELQPANADFFDTFARVQLKCGERDAAIASFRKAIDADPNKLEALIGLAGALIEAGQRDAATPLMSRVDELLKSKPAMTTQLRRELEAVRVSAKASL